MGKVTYTENQPLVSILLLSMNHQKFIEQCIHSITNQTYKNIEVLYLDNASQDDTYQIGLKSLIKSGIPYKSYQNNTSEGISRNLNFLLSQAKGEYISPLSSDDWFSPENIQKKVEFLNCNPDIGAVYSNGWIYDEQKGTSSLNNSSGFMRGKIFRDIMTKPNSIFYVGVLYRKDILSDLNGWDENLLIEDVDLYVRLSLLSRIDFLDIPLVYYRRSPGSVSKNINYMMEGKNQYFQKYKNADWINMKWWLGNQYRKMAARLIDENQLKNSVKYLLYSIKIYPYNSDNYRTLFYLIRKSFYRSDQTVNYNCHPE